MWSRFKKIYCINHPRLICLREVFRPLYVVLSLLGLFPYSVKYHNTTFRFHTIQKSIYLNAAGALLYITLISFFLAKHLEHIIFYHSIDTIAATEAIMTQMNYITELMLLTIFCIVAYVCAYYNRFKYVRILNVLASRMDPPNNNNGKVLKEISFQIRVIAMGWLTLTSLMQCFVNFTRNDGVWKKFMAFFTFNLPQAIQFTVLAFFYILVMMQVAILKNIREQAYMLAREKRVLIYGLTSVDMSASRKGLTLRQIELIYVEVSEVKQIVNRVFEAPLLVTMMQCFHTIVSESHIIYHGVVVLKDMNLHAIINCSVWIVYQLMKVYAVARAGDVLKMEVLKIGRAIHKIPTERLDIRFLLDVQHFSSVITFHKNELTVYGFFPLDATLTFKVLAAAAMYVIILVQFDKTK